VHTRAPSGVPIDHATVVLWEMVSHCCTRRHKKRRGRFRRRQGSHGPPLATGKSFRSMYGYGNHLRVRSTEGPLNTCESGVAATFSQSCRASSSDRNMTTSKLEYSGWVEEIIAVDYRRFELILLYCSWMQAKTAGACAMVKHDGYGFTLIKFDRLIPHSA
jgi:hypothetical protein